VFEGTVLAMPVVGVKLTRQMLYDVPAWAPPDYPSAISRPSKFHCAIADVRSDQASEPR